MFDTPLVIPVFNPSERLPGLVAEFRRVFSRLIVVDDGSATGTDVFASLENTSGVRLLRHPVNRGKGAALKTAFAEVLRQYPDTPGVVTADADGQHLVPDVARVADALLAHPDRLSIGVRTFAGRLPFRSLWGNLWTRGEFRLLTGRSVRDTQTGLRAIPTRLLPKLLEIPGDRYEYEIAVLVAAAKSRTPPVQVPIETVYEDGNRSSHFRPFADTVRTQAALFAAAVRKSPL